MKIVIVGLTLLSVALAQFNQGAYRPFKAQPTYRPYKPQPYHPKVQPIRPVQPVVPVRPTPLIPHPIIKEYHGAEIPIVRQSQDVHEDGSYQYSYETANGISAHEEGALKNVGNDVAESVSGAYQYTAPDGTPIAVSYVADENGFQPQGAHLPVGPEVPELILRSLEYIRTHPHEEAKILQPVRQYNRF